MEHVKFVQINSISFRELLFSTVGAEVEKDVDSPMVVLAPFKTFTTFGQEFSEAMKALELKWAARAKDDARAEVRIQYSGVSENKVVEEEYASHDPEDSKPDGYEAFLL